MDFFPRRGQQNALYDPLVEKIFFVCRTPKVSLVDVVLLVKSLFSRTSAVKC